MQQNQHFPAKGSCHSLTNKQIIATLSFNLHVCLYTFDTNKYRNQKISIVPQQNQAFWSKQTETERQVRSFEGVVVDEILP